VGRIENNQA